MTKLEAAGRRIRVGLLLSATPDQGGVYQYSQSILRAFAALPADQFDRVVFFSDDRWRGQIESLPGRRIGISVFERGLAYAWVRLGLPVRLWRALARLQPLSRALIREDCDLWIFPAQDRWSYLAPVRAIGVILDLMHRYQRRFPEFSQGGLYRLRENHYRAMCAWAQAILVESECGKQQAHESYGLPLERILPLPLVVPPPLRAATSASTTLTVPEKFFLYPAQFWPHKNHARLIRALGAARKRFPDMTLLLTGAKTREYPRLAELVHELGLASHVFFLGYVDTQDLQGLYRRARALVMPTFFGPTNTPPMEAMALGCPVAISNLYAMPEQVGDAGLLFDPESQHDIQHTLERLWADDALCAELHTRGLRRSQLWGERKFAVRLADHLRHALQLPPCTP